MSGHSYDETCPRCGSPNMNCYADHKPVNCGHGTCLYCGFQYYTKVEVMSNLELESARAEHNDDFDTDEVYPYREELNQEKIKMFDDWIHPTINIDEKTEDSQPTVELCPECGHRMIDHGTGETCEGCGHTDTN